MALASSCARVRIEVGFCGPYVRYQVHKRLVHIQERIQELEGEDATRPTAAALCQRDEPRAQIGACVSRYRIWKRGGVFCESCERNSSLWRCRSDGYPIWPRPTHSGTLYCRGFLGAAPPSSSRVRFKLCRRTQGILAQLPGGVILVPHWHRAETSMNPTLFKAPLLR